MCVAGLAPSTTLPALPIGLVALWHPTCTFPQPTKPKHHNHKMAVSPTSNPCTRSTVHAVCQRHTLTGNCPCLRPSTTPYTHPSTCLHHPAHGRQWHRPMLQLPNAPTQAAAVALQPLQRPLNGRRDQGRYTGCVGHQALPALVKVAPAEHWRGSAQPRHGHT